MAAVVSRESYFETGLGVLSDLGYGGLKLAEVCNRLGVTTGSFYHYFPNWPTYTRELVAHWMQARSAQVQAARAERDPRRRVGALLEEGLELPNGAESAIRVWSAIEQPVRAPAGWRRRRGQCWRVRGAQRWWAERAPSWGRWSG